MGPETLSASELHDPVTGQSVASGSMVASADYLPYDFQRPTTLAREHPDWEDYRRVVTRLAASLRQTLQDLPVALRAEVSCGGVAQLHAATRISASGHGPTGWDWS